MLLAPVEADKSTEILEVTSHMSICFLEGNCVNMLLEGNQREGGGTEQLPATHVH